MLRYSVPDALRTVYGTVEFGVEQQVACGATGSPCMCARFRCMQVHEPGVETRGLTVYVRMYGAFLRHTVRA